MSSKFFGNKLTPNTQVGKRKMKNTKSRGSVTQVVKKAGRGK